MVSRFFRSTDGRLAIWWPLLQAIVLWFAMLVVTEVLLASLLGQVIGTDSLPPR
jgi:hypothetical protein